MSPDLRSLPSVDRLLNDPFAVELIDAFGRDLTVEAFRGVLAEVRERFPDEQEIPDKDAIMRRARALLEAWTAPTLIPLINASGVIIQTNLGRAPLSPETMEAMQVVGRGYSNLEYDLVKGRRGSRLDHANELLKRLIGAEAALVVNNNAAAVLLVLTALARRRRVVIARSQLVEIGGGFRIPDVMRQSNARLLEVGTTNRVHLHDYEEAIEEPVALIMRAHRSNFRIIGFTAEPTLAEIASLAKRADIPLMDDLGSGALLDTARYGLGHEPMVQESLEAGADLVCFSGDKLVGGPQAGIIVGRGDLVAKLKKHPMARAVRADKLCLAGLSATLMHYLKGQAEQKIPVWRMISAPLDVLKDRAIQWQKSLGFGEVVAGQSTVGGGSLPEETLPTYLLALPVRSPNRVMNLLRRAHPPVIARVENNQVVLDPRTVLSEYEGDLLQAVASILNTILK